MRAENALLFFGKNMIEIRNLNKTFKDKNGEVVAVKDVNLKINDGEIYGIIGYSGAGKSTLIRLLNLLEKPDSGYISINGQVIYDSEGETLKGRELNLARKGIGMIFQSFNLLDRSNVYDNIAYPLKYTGKSKEEITSRVKELLELIGLEDKINAYPSQLSGGQKQRVAIARALASNPSVLLSDEATSALDPDATESILNLLQELNEKLHLTIVIITHEMSVIKRICERVSVMENGEVVEEGDVYQIFANPQQPITKKFINSASPVGKLEQLLKDNAITYDNEKGKLVKLTFGKDSVGDAIISEISRKFNVNLNIVLANVDNLREGTLGNMVAVISGEEEKVKETIEYLESNFVRVEVIK